MDDANRGNDLAVVEAALFLATHPLTRRALARILGDVPLAYVDRLLEDLQGVYADPERGIELVAEEGRALLRVKSAYVERVAHLAPQQDIPQPVLRTLAVIAYNQPITQADVVRVRGNKAYEHVKELEDRKLVRGEEHGRTVLLSVTEDFLRHFGLSTINEFRFHAVGAPAAREDAGGLEAAAPGPVDQEVGDGQDG
jgi:segregation and condensation protein B